MHGQKNIKPSIIVGFGCPRKGLNRFPLESNNVPLHNKLHSLSAWIQAMYSCKQSLEVCFNEGTAASIHHFVTTESSLCVLHWLDQCVVFNMFFWLRSVAYREGGFGVFKPPPPKFRRYRWSPRSHKQEEPASRFPFAIHCVLVRL